ncbi:MAG: protein kinase [Myxococcales bacterium]|nr:protein kinase [Myxococcales bacterium]
MANRANILYVDDDRDQLRMLQLSLRDEFEVDIAESGSQAVQMVAAKPDYAVVVSDMRMPRMNGAQFLGLVRELAPRAVRILLTGDADLDSAMAAVNEAYVFRYLTKPCPRAQLRQALQDAVGEYARQRAQGGLGSALQASGFSDQQPDPGPAVTDARLETHQLLGTSIAGRYRLEEALGVGGTAAVFRCHDQILEHDVALKLFPANLDAPAQQRVRRELLLARRLAHPNIVRTYDLGVDNGRAFITMEWLQGHDLRHELTAGAMEVRRAIALLTQVCRGLQHAHSHAVTHRDIKPENLFVEQRDTVRIMDFGLATAARSEATEHTNSLTGTAAYMSPEQIQHAGLVTPATDIYAVGAVAYELLTGEPPFDHPDVMAVIAGHIARQPKAPSSLRREVPEPLDRVVLTALAKQPEDRFPDCATMADALETIVARLDPQVA